MGLVNKYVDKLLELNIIAEEDREIYYFGLREFIILALNMISLFIIGLAFNMVFEFIGFILAYGSLRVYAGGFHATTRSKCYMFSIIMVVISLVIIKNLPTSRLLLLTLLIASDFFILLLGPVEDKNKPLDQIEVRVYGKRMKIVLLLLNVIVLAFKWLDIITLSKSIVIGISAVTIMVLLGEIVNRKIL